MLIKENLNLSQVSTKVLSKTTANLKIEDALKQYYYKNQNNFIYNLNRIENNLVKKQKHNFNVKIEKINHSKNLYWKKTCCYLPAIIFFCKKHFLFKHIWLNINKQTFYLYLEFLKQLKISISKIMAYETLSICFYNKKVCSILLNSRQEFLQQNKNFVANIRLKKSQSISKLLIFKTKRVFFDQIIYVLNARFFLNQIYFFNKKINIFYIKNVQNLNFVQLTWHFFSLKLWASKIQYNNFFFLKNRSFAKTLNVLFIKNFLKKSYWDSKNIITQIFYRRNLSLNKKVNQFSVLKHQIKLNLWKKNPLNLYNLLKKNKKSKHIFVQKQNFMFEDSKNSFYTAVQKVNKKLFFFENSDENFIGKDLIVKSLKNFKNYLLLLQKEKKERITKTFLVFIKKAVLNKTYNTQQYINILKQLLENQKFKKFNFKKLFLNVLKLNWNRYHKKKTFFRSKIIQKNPLFLTKKSKVNDNSNWISKWKLDVNKSKSKTLSYLYSILKSQIKQNPIPLLKDASSFQQYQKKRYIKKKKEHNLKLWTEHNVVLNNFHLQINNLKEVIFFLTKNKLSVFFINAFSISKFNWILEKQLWSKKMRLQFFKNMQRRFFTKYRTSAIYLKDLLCICFFSFFLKKPTFLLNFVAFQIVHIQKNKKETVLIRFLIKTLKSFANQRPEITGLCIKFRGRVNRWRRTKSIIGTTKHIAFQSFKSRLEYGTAKAINKKGVIGIRLWIAYSVNFQSILKNTTFEYANYSKDLYKNQIKKFTFPLEVVKFPF